MSERRKETQYTTIHLCARLGNGTKVVDQIGLGHTNTSVSEGKDLVLLVRNDADIELLLVFKRSRVCERRVADFVKSIRAIGDQLPQEDFLVGVKSIC